jgi:hypothetical protein
MGLLDRRNVGPRQCAPNDVIEKVVALRSAWIALTGKRMQSPCVNLGAAVALMCLAELNAKSSTDGDADGFIIETEATR